MATHHLSFPDFQELRLPSLNLANVYSNQSLVAGAFFVQENSQLADLNEFPPRESMNHVNAPIFPSRFFFPCWRLKSPSTNFCANREYSHRKYATNYMRRSHPTVFFSEFLLRVACEDKDFCTFFSIP